MTLIRAEIQMKRPYKCAKCKHQELGDTERHTTSLLGNSYEIKAFIDALPLRASNMPTGWANGYDTGFRCPNCKPE